MRRKISPEIWEQVKTAFAAGIGLREIARNMNLPAGTVLARAQREGWTKQIQTVKQQAAPMQSTAITPMQSVVVSMQERAERHVDRMAGVTEKVLPHLEKMPPDSILDRVNDIEKYDRLARRNYGLSDKQADAGSLSLNVLSGRGGRTRIAIEQEPNQTPAQDQA
jgi:hypothetical protein